ncbi:MAG: OPT family oligopeptide transporter [Patescibacteria group bacterium]
MIKQLTKEQVRTMTPREKDTWWLNEVYRGDMPQLTLRSALTGAFLGGFLCLTNLYIGIKTGWTLGVGLTSVILSYAMFKFLAKVKLGNEMTILENNAMQSCATAAGYMTGPLIASISAYMMITGKMLPMYQVITWVIALAFLGVLYAFPLKRRFINNEQHDFPEGKACGILLDGLHSGEDNRGGFITKILTWSIAFSALFAIFRSETLLKWTIFARIQIPEMLEDYILRFTSWRPSILGTKFENLTIGIETDIAMFAAGGLMSPKTGISLLVGACINFFILAPYFISTGVIATADYKTIVMWSLWGGVAMMATASFFPFFANPTLITNAFKGAKELLNRIRGKKSTEKKEEDPLKDIELPLKVFYIGIPVVGAVVVVMAKFYFGIDIWLGVLAIPLVFVFTVIGVNSTALTSITPSGALGKLTQATYAIAAPGQIITNIMTAGITAEAAGNAANLNMDIKPGYMLGAKPRHQAISHAIGAVVGTCVAVPVFYSLLGGQIALLGSDTMPLPGAIAWKAVAEVLMGGFGSLHYSAQVAMVIGAILGIGLEAINHKTKGKFPLSPVGLGLAFFIPFSLSITMAAGSFFFNFMHKRVEKKEDEKIMTRIFKEHETLCGGLIAGAALMGIVIMMIKLKM